MTKHRAPVGSTRLAVCAMAAVVLYTNFDSAMAADAGDCARDMARETFHHRQPDPQSKDPRGKLPERMTAQERQALHPVLFPTDSSIRLSVSHWIHERNFRCLEQAFFDIETAKARYPTGQSKVASFLGGIDSFVRRHQGMTERDIARLVDQWRTRFPDSILAELASPRMLMSAAWQIRGDAFASNVSPERMREFRRLNATAFERVKSLGPKAREHLLGHYIGLWAIVNNGGEISDVQRFAIESLRRFPNELFLPSDAAIHMLPKWGGKPEDLEGFARSAMDVVGEARAAMLYAVLYANAVGVDQLHKHPLARMALIKAGLVQLASFGAHSSILTLQTFACNRRDLDALRQARNAWTKYALQPQVKPPSPEVDASCRQWLASLPTEEVASLTPPTTTQAAAAKPLPPREAQAFYSVVHGNWERFDTSTGEVFSCKDCGAPVNVLIAVWDPLDPGVLTNDQFMASVQARSDQMKVISRHLEVTSGLKPQASGMNISVDGLEFVRVDGISALRYEASIKSSQASLHERAIELMHRGRLIRISVNRGPANPRASDFVAALVGSIKLLPQ
jgi:hypothetical protein